MLPGAEAFKRDMIISLRRRAGARFGEAEEIADVMACVVSPTARWMTYTTVDSSWNCDPGASGV